MALPVLRNRSNAPARWDPFAELDELYDRMGRLLDSTFGSATGDRAGAWAPLADVTETDDAYRVEVELPGVTRDQVNVELADRELVITGETRTDDEGVRHWRSRRYGRFEYRTMLPGEVDAEQVTASMADGVLTVTVPKTATGKPRRIEITSG